MGRHMDPKRRARMERLFAEHGFKRVPRTVFGSQAEVKAFSDYRKRKKAQMGTKASALLQAKTEIASSKVDNNNYSAYSAVANPVSTDIKLMVQTDGQIRAKLKEVVVGWGQLAEGIQDLYVSAFRAACNCDGNSPNVQCWKSLMRVFQPQFNEKTVQKTITPEEYAGMMQEGFDLSRKQDAENLFHALLEDHIKINGHVTAESYKLLRDAYEKQASGGEDGGVKIPDFLPEDLEGGRE